MLTVSKFAIEDKKLSTIDVTITRLSAAAVALYIRVQFFTVSAGIPLMYSILFLSPVRIASNQTFDFVQQGTHT